jgi:DNA polymerase-3 subunit alpha
MQLENLSRAGSFDRLDANRARVFSGAETILRRAQADLEEKESGQIGLFGGTAKPEPLRLPEIADWPPLERLAFEAEAVGFHLTAHPLDAYAQALRRLGVTSSIHVEARAVNGVTRVKIAGTVVAMKERITRTGSRMAWVRISDAAGSIEVTCFSEVLKRRTENRRRGGPRHRHGRDPAGPGRGRRRCLDADLAARNLRRSPYPRNPRPRVGRPRTGHPAAAHRR